MTVHRGSRRLRSRGVAALVIGVASVMPVQAQTFMPMPSGSFVQNAGQWDTQARFVAQRGSHAVRVEPTGLLLQVVDVAGRGVLVAQRFTGARDEVVPTAAGLLPGVRHYLVGNDRTRWRRDVPAFGEVVYEDLYPGVTMRVRATPTGCVQRFECGSADAASDIAWHLEGIEFLRSRSDGSLEASTSQGWLRLTAWRPDGSGAGDARRTARLVAAPDGMMRFGTEETTGGGASTIELGLEWATYLGGSQSDQMHAVAVAPDGDVIVAGETLSLDFPLTPGAFDSTFVGNEISISRLSGDGASLVYSTYVGGSLGEAPSGVHCDPEGQVTCAGYTGSKNFPVTPGAFDTVVEPGTLLDGFVLRLASDGGSLVFATYLGGPQGSDLIRAMTVDDAGNVYVTGPASSAAFPVTEGAFDTTFSPGGFGHYNAFVTRLAADGSSLVFSTFLGSSGLELPEGIALSPEGDVVVVGRVGSTDFPFTPGTFMAEADGTFLVRLSGDGTQLLAATSFDGGGLGSTWPRAVTVGPSGEVVVVGETSGENFPVQEQGFQPVKAVFATDGFVLVFDSLLSELRHSTYYGGFSSTDIAFSVVVEGGGSILIGGITGSGNLPTTAGAWDSLPPIAPKDGYVARFSPDLTELWYGTYIGGECSSEDQAQGGISFDPLAAFPDGSVVFASKVIHCADGTGGFPVTPGAFQSTPPSTATTVDMAIAKLTLLPYGVLKLGDSTPGAAGLLVAGVTAQPQVGRTDFRLTCSHAPPQSNAGWLLVGSAALAIPVQAAGASIWVDLRAPHVLMPVQSNAIGASIVRFGIPSDPVLVGVQAVAQFAWKDPGAPLGRLSASNALRITIQP